MSNRYIFIYASVMVIIVAAILAAAASVLKPYQEANIRIAKMNDILLSVGIESDSKNAEDQYAKYIVKEIAINPEGEIISEFENGAFTKGEGVRPFEINLKKELKKIEKKEAGQELQETALPLYICNKNGETIYIIPLYGKGLWGPIWGNIALKDDFRTVLGVTFGHKGETPGLGAEIEKAFFQKKFIGKTIFSETYEFTSIQVVKGGVKNLTDQSNEIHSVDAISGGTITSDAVTMMLENCLNNYVEFIKDQLNNE